MARNNIESTATASILDRLIDTQAGLTGLSGYVADATGVPLEGVLLKIENADKTLQREALSQPAGRYEFPRLDPGLYQLTAEMVGFKKLMDQKVLIEVSQLYLMNISMIHGSPEETTIVSGRAKLAQSPALSRSESVRRLKVSVRRDLEWLFNTRRIAVEPDLGLKELNHSVYMFGLPDLTGFSLTGNKDRLRLLRLLQATVKLFEPRLANVRIVPVEIPETGRSALNFRIEGLLLMDPTPERVSFDTVLKLSSGEYEVKGESDAG